MLAWVAEAAFAVEQCVAAEVELARGLRLDAAEVVVWQIAAGLEEKRLESELASGSAGQALRLGLAKSIGRIHRMVDSQELEW